jgi:hypothetical protein
MQQMRIEDFADYIDFPTPSRVGVVYVIFWIANDQPIPLYVGQTGRFLARMEEYFDADFMAATDFKVGAAVKYLRDVRERRIVVAHRQSDDRFRDESQLIRDLQSQKARLLNELPGYNYRTANIEEQRKKIEEFCDQLLSAQ